MDVMLRSLAICSTLVLPVAAQRGHSVTEQPRARVSAAAHEIDRLVRADLAAHGQHPNPRIDDATFVRRLYLDVAGRIPALEEARAFLGSRDPERRQKLIDRLLDSPGHQSHMFNYWADLLRAKSKLARRTSGEPYLAWIKQAIADDEPYDRMVTDLLTASGAAHARGNGATGYYMRDRGMPEDNMANTARVFLGTRVECAQCHDHPFDHWTQRQFYQMVAFTGGIDYGVPAADRSSTLLRVGRELRNDGDREGLRALRLATRTVSSGVSGSGTGAVPLPDDYRGDDAAPGSLVTAKTLFGDSPKVEVREPAAGRQRRARRPAKPGRRKRGPRLPEIGSRALYAEWLTSPDNPRFALVGANRMWKHVMGRGVIEPVDDVKDDTVPDNPALMAYLQKLLVDLDFDLRQFQRVLFNTDTYQRRAVAHAPGPGEAFHFEGPLLRRMSAEQMWDSLLTLVIDDLDATLAAPGAAAEPIYRRYEEFEQMDEDEVRALVTREKLRYTDPDAYRATRRRERMKQAAERRAARGKAGRAALAELRELRGKLRRARRAHDGEQVDALRAELKARTAELTARRLRARRRGGAALARASDLPSPAPPGHFLRQFGQSDREQIEAANRDANVPQVLSLLNGIVETDVLDSGSALMRRLAAAGSADAQIEAAFLAMLGRKPERTEAHLFRPGVQQGEQGLRDMVWALANTNEFRFIQ